MLIPYSWLKDFINLKKPAEQVAIDLSLSVIGVGEIQQSGREKVLNLDVTYNRGDLLSIVGVARELATLYNLKFKREEKQFAPPKSSGALRVKNNPKLAKTYTLTKVSNLSYKSTPKLIKSRLEAAGMQPVNFWADLTNYVMLEYGQPFHAFDAEKVARRDPSLSIEVRQAKKGEKIKTLDGLNHILSKNDIVIADKRGPIAVAGVMGGKDTEVDEGTTEILLEAAIFNPTSIRKTARRLGLRSEASGRFEHYLSPENLLISLNKLTHLYQLHGKGKITGFAFTGGKKTELPSVVLTQKKLNTVSGKLIPINQARICLQSLGFKVMSSDKGLLCWPPYSRGDISIPEDLVEEVLRLYGYENLPSQPLQTILSEAPENKFELWRDRITHLLANLGFNEVKTYPFVSTKSLVHLDKGKLLKLKNPISVETEYLRPNLLLSLLETAQQNAPRRREGKIFELEKTYPKGGEVFSLGVLVWGAKNPFSKLKGILEAISQRAYLEVEFASTKNEFFHPTRSAEIKIRKKSLGIMGLAHPYLADAYGLPDVAILELNFEKFAKLANSWGKFTPISSYPETYEDFSFVLPEKYSLGKLINRIKSASNLVKEVELVDRYVKKGIRSLTLRVTFQSEEKGLSAKDVKPVRKKIQSTIHRSGGTIRS